MSSWISSGFLITLWLLPSKLMLTTTRWAQVQYLPIQRGGARQAPSWSPRRSRPSLKTLLSCSNTTRSPGNLKLWSTNRILSFPGLPLSLNTNLFWSKIFAAKKNCKVSFFFPQERHFYGGIFKIFHLSMFVPGKMFL